MSSQFILIIKLIAASLFAAAIGEIIFIFSSLTRGYQSLIGVF